MSAVSGAAKAGSLSEEFKAKQEQAAEAKRKADFEAGYKAKASECMDAIKIKSRSSIAQKELETKGSGNSYVTWYVITALTKNNMICQCSFNLSTFTESEDSAACVKN